MSHYRVLAFLLVRFIGISMGIGMPLLALAEAERSLIYPKSSDDWRSAYSLELLTRALNHSGGNYQLVPGLEDVPKARNFLHLSTNRDVDVIWSMTSIEREAEHLAVRIPINRGLMGYRVALVSSRDKDILAKVESLAQLKQFTAGQMYIWSDTKILTSQGLTVVPGSSYTALFRMLVAGRFDFFPRSVTEVSQELALNEAMGIRLDPHILIRYPAAMYFFVNKKDIELAADIEKGLELMLASGEFHTLFNQYYSELIEQLKLEARQPIDLENPFLPAATPLCRRELWWANLCPSSPHNSSPIKKPE